MKLLALALHNDHGTHRHFPAAYSAGKEGRPLPRRRVQIFPDIEQTAPYEQFHLGEPWDSEHNKKLIPSMTRTLRTPGSKAAPGKANYLGVGGPHGVFPGKGGQARPRGVHRRRSGHASVLRGCRGVGQSVPGGPVACVGETKNPLMEVVHGAMAVCHRAELLRRYGKDRVGFGGMGGTKPWQGLAGIVGPSEQETEHIQREASGPRSFPGEGV